MESLDPNNINITSIFVEEYTYNACKPEIRKQVIKMVVNGTGTRATGRILGISKDSVTDILKKVKIGIGK